MSAALIGALAGLVVALAELVFLRALTRRVELAETKRALNVAGAVQLVLLPVAGWLIGPLVVGD